MTTTCEQIAAPAPTSPEGLTTPPRESPAAPAAQCETAEWGSRTAAAGGLLIATLGLLEMLAWPLRWTWFLRVRAVYVPTPFNTALALAVTGAALVLAARRQSRWIWVAGSLDLAVGGATLVQTAFGWDLRIDQLFVNAYLVGPGQPPGRMASNTAVCFLVIGATLLTFRPFGGRRSAARLTAAAAVVACTALIPSAGFLAGIISPKGWLNLMPMALPTALAMCLVAGSLLALSWAVKARSSCGDQTSIAVPAAAAAFVAILLTWQALVDTQRSRSIPVASASRAVLLLAVLAGALLSVTATLAQRAGIRQAKAEELTALLGEEVERRTRAEAVACDHEQLLVQLIEALPVGVIITKAGGDPDLVFLVNRAAAAMFGRGFLPNVLVNGLGEAYGTFLAGTNQPYPQGRSPSARALAGETSHVDDMEFHRPDGVVVPVEVWGTPVTGEAGEVRFGLAAFADITERRRDEQALAERADLLDLAVDGIYARDAQHRITYWNHGAETCFGWTQDEALGQSSYELLHTVFTEPVTSIEATLRRDGRWRGELVQRSKSGERIDIVSRWAARFGPDGCIESVLAVDTNVTARKTAEREAAARAAEVEALNLDLARSNDELEQFAYIASHDLSEPLRAISGPVSLLARRYRGQLDPDADRFIEFAVDGCQRMQTLINDLLAFSRIGRQEQQALVVDSNELMEHVLTALKPALDVAHAHVTVDALAPIVGNPTELAQVFQNLVANAIKFSRPDAPPEIHVSIQQVDGQPRFVVTDNGIGIEARHRERIFGMFKRLHGRDAYAGTGIGLALCKKIVERHHGAIGVEQGPDGVGSTFWFTVPRPSEVPS
jgi:PAS domain S-box-containing protein